MIRVSCFVIRENLGIRAGPEGTPRRAAGYRRVSGLVFRKGLKISGLRLVNGWEALICDAQGTLPRRLRVLVPSRPGQKKQD